MQDDHDPPVGDAAGGRAVVHKGAFRLRQADTSQYDLLVSTERALLHYKSGVRALWHRFDQSAGVLALVICERSSPVFGGMANGWIQTWQLGQSESARFGQHGSQAVRSLALAGRRLFSGSWDCSCVIWDAESGQPLCRMAHHRDRCNVVVCSTDGQHLFSGGKDGLLIHCFVPECEVKRVHVLRGHSRAVRAIALGETEETVFSGGWQGEVVVWTRNELTRSFEVHSGAINDMVWCDATESRPRRFTRCQCRCAECPSLLFTCSNDGTLRMCDWEKGSCLGKLATKPGSIKCIACRGDILFWGSYDGTLHQVLLPSRKPNSNANSALCTTVPHHGADRCDRI